MVIKTDLPAVVGSSGLVGSFLINNLSVLYPKVISYSRRKIHFDKKNVKNIIIDFNNLEMKPHLKKSITCILLLEQPEERLAVIKILN